MNWLTQEEIKEASKDEMDALECSLKHHKQGAEAGSLELQNALMDKKFALGWRTCSCCALFNGDADCAGCPLGKVASECCGSEYNRAYDAYDRFKEDPSNANHYAFQEAEKKVVDYIQGVIDGKKAKKPKLRHGDYGYNAGTPESAMAVRLLNGTMTAMTAHGVISDLELPLMNEPKVVLGNIFDDLTALSEDVTEFEIADEDGDIIEVNASSRYSGGVHLKAAQHGVTLTAKKVRRLILKLQQVEATLKRGEKK
jgi:hypothetical protein